MNVSLILYVTSPPAAFSIVPRDVVNKRRALACSATPLLSNSAFLHFHRFARVFIGLDVQNTANLTGTAGGGRDVPTRFADLRWFVVYN